MLDECSVPSESDFLLMFGVGPQETRPEDGFWSYMFVDGNGVALQLSFNTHERSLQTTILVGGTVVSTVVAEGLLRTWIDDEGNGHTAVKATFTHAGASMSAEAMIVPRIVVNWETLCR